MASFNFLFLIFALFISFIACQSSNKVIVGYFTDWTVGQYPVSSIDFSKVTHINYAFAMFNENFNPIIETESTLNELVTKAHQANVKVLVSIGGWTGSKYFSPMAADKSKRARFISNTVTFANKFNLDGIDIDWEYPGRQGEEGNFVSPQDTANYLLLLKELRVALGSKLITAAVRVEPLDGPNGPLSDVREFSVVFDWVNLMCYDINGPWSATTGPNGGLDYQSGKGTQFSIKQAIGDWSKAGFSYDKLVVGVPFYGYAEGVGVDMSNTDQYVPITNNKLSAYTYNELFSRRILKSPLEANEAEGWIRKFDPITQTPWLFNKNTKTFIAYEDTQSLKAKTEYIRCTGLRGAMLWAMSHDYQNQLFSVLQNVYNTNPCNGQITTTSTSTTTTTSTTSKSPISTTQGPEPTGSCTDGSYTCGSTKGPTYYQCAHGKWVEFSCPSSSVCVQAGNSIYCGTPITNILGSYSIY